MNLIDRIKAKKIAVVSSDSVLQYIAELGYNKAIDDIIAMPEIQELSKASEDAVKRYEESVWYNYRA